LSVEFKIQLFNALKTVANLQQTVNQKIPVYFDEANFNEFVLPHLLLNKRGPRPKISYYKYFHYILHVLYTGCQWKMLCIEKDANGNPEIHYTQVWRKWKYWIDHECITEIFYQSVQFLIDSQSIDLTTLNADGTNVVSKLRAQGVGYSGHKHQRGDKIIPIVDHAGNILAPMTVAPVNQSDMIQLPRALKDLDATCEACDLVIPAQTPINLDAGFDSRKNRQLIWKRKLKPNIKENPRGRKKKKRGRPRYFDKAKYKQRTAVERTFAWEDKFRRILVRYEWLQETYLAFHLIAFTLINFRTLIRV
jgi:transposase